MPEYIGTSKAAEILGYKRDYISKLCREGKFMTAEQDGSGKPWRISEKEIYEFLKKKNGGKK